MVVSKNKRDLNKIDEEILEVIQKKALINQASLEELEVETKDLAFLKEEKEEALVLTLIPSKEEFSFLTLLDQIFGLENNFSFCSNPLDYDLKPASITELNSLLKDLGKRKSLLVKEFKNLVEKAKAMQKIFLT